MNFRNFSNLIAYYSLDVQKNDHVLIMGTTEIKPLLLELIPILLNQGAFVDVDLKDNMIDEIVYHHGSLKQINKFYNYKIHRLKEFDKILNFMSETNLYFRNMNSDKMNSFYNGVSEYLREYNSLIEANKLFVSTMLYPTNAYAQKCCLSTVQFQDLFSKVNQLDNDNIIEYHKNMEKCNAEIISELDLIKNIRIIGKNTDLRFSVEGRKWINGCGKINLPDGEVFTAPIKESVNGKIAFTYPIIYNGIEISDIELDFQEGKVINYSTSNNDAFHNLLTIDEGACYIGEIGIGTNYSHHEFIGNIIFDEKIGGTIHLALGASYPECGEVNASSIHIDMIYDTIDQGEVFIDDKLFIKNRKIYNKCGEKFYEL